MSHNEASKTFGVPRSTLSDKLDGRSPEDRRLGPNPVLVKLRRMHWPNIASSC